MHRVGGTIQGVPRWAAVTRRRCCGGGCKSLIHPSGDFLSDPKSVLGSKIS